MKEIKLTQGMVALVDDKDYDYLMQWKWYALKNNNTHYAVRSVVIDGKHRSIKMHRVILNTPDELLVDHLDHNGLNNQRSNIRNVTHTGNCLNRTPYGSSPYIGVDRYYDRGKYRIRARISYNGRRFHIGFFKTEEDAAKAYDIFAIRYYGESAIINFPQHPKVK